MHSRRMDLHAGAARLDAVLQTAADVCLRRDAHREVGDFAQSDDETDVGEAFDEKQQLAHGIRRERANPPTLLRSGGRAAAPARENSASQQRVVPPCHVRGDDLDG